MGPVALAALAQPALGGLLIGGASAALLLFSGRIAGVSGIFAGVLGPTRGDLLWRLTFVLGLVVGGWVTSLLAPELFATELARSTRDLLFAGMLVGVGTRLANGCTSGHGVCGIARLSPRSLVATLTFIASGGLVVGLTRALAGGAP